MKQHLFRGRGAPDFVPSGYSHVYLDTINMQHWISIGNSTAEDWSGPFVTEADVQKALNDYISGIDDLARKVIQYVDVVDYPTRGRFITIDPAIHAGKFLIARDLDLRPDIGFKIEIVPSSTVRLGSQIWLLNGTSKDTSLDNYNCFVNYPLGMVDTKLEPKGVMVVRPIDINLEMFTYLITGTLNSTIEAPTGTIDARDLEHRADKNNPHETDKDQIGLGNVPNYEMATGQEAIEGEALDKFMSPGRTASAIAAQALTPLNNHVNDTDNPHLVTKDQIDLGNVMNYLMAVDLDGVYAGEFDEELTSDQLYATPRTIRVALERFKELNPAEAVFASTVQAILAGQTAVTETDVDTSISPYLLAEALLAFFEFKKATWAKMIDGIDYRIEGDHHSIVTPAMYGEGLNYYTGKVTATREECESAVSNFGENVENKFVTPNGLSFALALLREGLGGGGIEEIITYEFPYPDGVLFTELTLRAEDIDKSFVKLIQPNDAVLNLVRLELDANELILAGVDFALINVGDMPMMISFLGGGNVIWNGVNYIDIDNGNQPMVLPNGVVRVKLIDLDGEYQKWSVSGGVELYRDGLVVNRHGKKVVEAYSSAGIVNWTFGDYELKDKFMVLKFDGHAVGETGILKCLLSASDTFENHSECIFLNTTSYPVQLSTSTFGVIYKCGVTGRVLDSVIPAGGLVNLKFLQMGDSPDWYVWGDFEALTPIPGPKYLEKLAYNPVNNPSQDIEDWPQQLDSTFTTILPYPGAAPKSTYTAMLQVEESVGQKVEFHYLNRLPGRLKLLFNQYSNVIYSGKPLDALENGTVYVKSNGLVHIRLIKQEQYDMTWLVSGDLDYEMDA